MKRGENHVTGQPAKEGSGKDSRRRCQEEKGSQMSKGEKEEQNSSMSEKPVHSRLRRLVDWINLTGAKMVHGCATYK